MDKRKNDFLNIYRHIYYFNIKHNNAYNKFNTNIYI